MQPLITLLRLTASALIMLYMPSPTSTRPHLITSGMDAVVGHAGWYTSNVTIHTAIFADPEILSPASDILVEREGLNEVPIPDGMGGTATQFVNIDKTAPVVSITDVYVRSDGATVLSVTVSDLTSGPAILDISFDRGFTWQSYSAQSGYLAPEHVWSVEINQGLAIGSPSLILARAVDVAGNMSAATAYIGAEE